jgi:DNA invertase Pin-like site-specific DNA recombinase
VPVNQGSVIKKSGRVFGQGQKAAKTIRAGLYARVSTPDQQTLAMQNKAMREYAARRRQIDVVLIWRQDRWGRSVTDLLATLQELKHFGVGFVSLTEALDLSTPAGRAMAAPLAVFAAFEREILGERVRAGLAHARQNGNWLGRPLTAGLHASQIRKLHRAGLSKSEIAR